MKQPIPSQGINRLRYLSLAGIFLALVVIVLGAYTRLVDAGLGCPDWPGCYGFAMVPHTEARLSLALERFPDAPVDWHKGWAEMVHRYVAGLLLVLISTLVVIALRRARQEPMPVGLVTGLLALVITQALFGMWTVTLKLWPQVVTAHLLGGFATLSLLLLLYLRLRPLPPPVAAAQRSRLRSFRPWALGGLVLVVAQIALGGWTSSNYAALACTDFPTCQGSFWPRMDFPQGFDLLQQVGPNYLGGLLESEARTAIHMTHRLGALLVLVYLAVLLARLWRGTAGTGLRPVAAAVAAALLLQISLGLSNIFWLLPLPVAVAHNAGGALLLLSLVWLNQRLFIATEGTASAEAQVEEKTVHENNHRIPVHL